MIDLGLTAGELRAYERALATSHRMEVEITLRDRDERPLGALVVPGGAEAIGGGVTVDDEQPVNRLLALEVLDPSGRLQLDPDSPSDSAIWPSHFVEVVRRDHVAELGRWVDCPVMWGPLTAFDRRGAEVSIEAQGKEARALEPYTLWRTIRVPRRMRATDGIERLLRRQGERRFDFPRIGARIKKPRSAKAGQEAWPVAQKIARKDLEGRQLFYDARGRARLRQTPEDPAFAFIEGGEDGIVAEDPRVGWDLLSARNALVVRGRAPKGRRKAPVVRVVAPRNHPLSPQSLARNGEPTYLVEEIDLDIPGRAALRREGQRELRKRLFLAQTVEFTCQATPHLEPQDLVVLRRATGERIPFVLRRFVIPLDDTPMEVGTTERLLLLRGRKNRRKKKR